MIACFNRSSHGMPDAEKKSLSCTPTTIIASASPLIISRRRAHEQRALHILIFGFAMVSTDNRVFISFLAFGLLNNILYVVILTAAIDIVGYSVPKATVLLADIMPSLAIKLLAPFFIHAVPYKTRIFILVILSLFGMLCVGLSPKTSLHMKLGGIMMASLSSGLGEVSFLQLTHFYGEKQAIGGFSMGTGGAGIMGSFCFLAMTNILRMSSQSALLMFAAVPLGLPIMFFLVLPDNTTVARYHPFPEETNLAIDMDADFYPDSWVSHDIRRKWDMLILHVEESFRLLRPLIKPYMIPLCSVYIAEYVINQGISPTLLFSLNDLPRWLFRSYRDIYVAYGFVYQFGVFLSRSSVTFGFHFPKLYLLSLLQFFNVIIVLHQSLYDLPFTNIYPLMILILYEGLLGGLLYVNTFMSVSQNVRPEDREFSMACVGISDSFGIMIAGVLSIWLEMSLCTDQVRRGRDWCDVGA